MIFLIPSVMGRKKAISDSWLIRGAEGRQHMPLPWVRFRLREVLPAI